MKQLGRTHGQGCHNGQNIPKTKTFSMIKRDFGNPVSRMGLDIINYESQGAAAAAGAAREPKQLKHDFLDICCHPAHIEVNKMGIDAWVTNHD